MRPKYFGVWLGSITIGGLLGPATAGIFAQASQPAPKSGTVADDYECHGNSCAVSLDDVATAKSVASTPTKPYDWKASFKEYKVGKVPRTTDGKPDMQGI